MKTTMHPEARKLPFEPIYHQRMQDGSWMLRVGANGNRQSARDEARRIAENDGTVSVFDLYGK
ncbi:hypothetical protein R70006_05071 [Paraburkholderia domus]|uniref:hypothetical protein n=1 Tax=Paraburkholderia domus TaxID=2793075 RepID=UPI001912430A|nr:hypothetical protein [Paraburkholderia domus]MBK5051692.1 hypothetical protein [Burkholderia sp. R-70006]CAE6795863.1 hypothetical protein R70006_05071 [Paraburkholderia domus]